MKSRFTLALVALVALAATIPSTALAATEFGDTCVGDATAPGDFTLTTLAAPPAPLPLTAPVGGVITKVKMQTESFGLTVPTSVKAMRSIGGSTFTVVAESRIDASGGTAVADARMPVQAGDRLGLHGIPTSFEGMPPQSFSVYCAGLDGSQLGAVEGDVTTGRSATFFPATAGRVPLAAVIEPDADNDGYGDETQDACPQSATTQGICPPVVLQTSKQVRKGSVTIIVTSSTAAPVSVKGVANLGKGKKAKLNGGTKSLAPGVLGKFTLRFSKALKAKLRELSPKQKLTLKVTVQGTSVSGTVTKKTLKVKLKGQEKPSKGS